MILTDKCKEDFLLTYFSIGNIYTLEDMPYVEYDFDLVQNSSKYSLIIDFFDSKNIEIEILRHRITPDLKLWRAKINNELFDELEYKNSRLEATIEAIKKANEIYNKKIK